MSRLLALDAVLLFPPSGDARFCDLNAELVERHGGEYLLDATHLPHVTLVQQGIRAAERQAVEQAIGEEARNHEAIPLRFAALGQGGSTVHLRIAPDEALLRLHEALLARLKPFVAGPVDGGAFHHGGDDEPARPNDSAWVNEFRARAILARFDPHVTLGIGELPSVAPFELTTSRLALCWLGRYCTCRVILREWRLGR